MLTATDPLDLEDSEEGFLPLWVLWLNPESQQTPDIFSKSQHSIFFGPSVYSPSLTVILSVFPCGLGVTYRGILYVLDLWCPVWLPNPTIEASVGGHYWWSSHWLQSLLEQGIFSCELG